MVDAFSLLSVLLPPFAGFVLGVASGWSLREITKEQPVSHRAVTTGLAVIITIVWMVSIITAIDTQNYSTPAGLHAVMGAVAGYFFKGGGILDRNSSGDNRRGDGE